MKYPYALSVDSKGIFYVAFNRLGCPDNPDGPYSGTCNGVPNKVGVARSTDGGRTWSAPVDTPVARAATPRLRVDAATDAVYAVGSTGVGNPGPSAITVSRDHGFTWSPLAPLPDQPFGNQIAVHRGVLATATAEKIVDGTTVVPTDVVFQVSRDGGRNFTAFPVTDSHGTPVPPASGDLVPDQRIRTSDPIPWVTADPTEKNRFAILLPRDDNLEVYVTRNAGRTWTGPTVVSAPGASKPWIEFGPKGELGIMWRHLAAGAVDAYSTVSFDRGRSFSRPVRVNRTTQPFTFLGSGGDEWSRTVPPPRNSMCWLRWGRRVLFGHVLVAELRHVPLRCGWVAGGLISLEAASRSAKRWALASSSCMTSTKWPSSAVMSR